MSAYVPMPGFPLLIAVPIGSINWKTIDTHILLTPLGIDECRVEVVDTDEYVALKPGEDERIRRHQARVFCQRVLDIGGDIVGTQVWYLKGLLDVSFVDLASMSGLSVSTLVRVICDPDAHCCSLAPEDARILATVVLRELQAPGDAPAVSPSSSRDA